jgi:hypothetical protein
MLSSILAQPYLFVIILSLLASAVVFLYTRTTEKMPGRENARQAFFKTLAATSSIGILLTYLARRGGGGDAAMSSGATVPGAVLPGGGQEPFFAADSGTGVPAI